MQTNGDDVDLFESHARFTDSGVETLSAPMEKVTIFLDRGVVKFRVIGSYKLNGNEVITRPGKVTWFRYPDKNVSRLRYTDDYIKTE